MKLIKLSIVIFSTIFMLNFFSSPLASASTSKEQILNNSSTVGTTKTEDMDSMKEEIRQTAENADFNSTVQKAREYSLPILVALVFIAIFLFLLGIFVPQMKVAAWTVFLGGIVFFVIVNYTEKIIGLLLAIVDWIMEIF